MNRLLILITAILLASTVRAGESIDKTLDVKTDGSVAINVMRGKLTITGWKKNQVKVNGEIDDNATGYTFETSGGRTVFKIEMPNSAWGDHFTGDGSDLEIMVPVQNEIRFNGVNTNVTADGVSGGTEIHVVNGNIDISDLSGAIYVETVNGGIKGSNLNGDIKLKTVNGEITDTGSKGELNLATVNGTITTKTDADELSVSGVSSNARLTLNKIRKLKVSTVSGNVDVSVKALDKNASVKLSSVSGGLKLGLPKSVSAAFNIHANAGGQIVNSLSEHQAVKAEYGPSQSLQFSLKEGGAEINMSTISGHIELTGN